MIDPIERQNAIDACIRVREYRAYDEIEEIKALPPAQSEQETATWIIDSGYPQHCWCSNCNHRFDLFDPKLIHFCPNCGREMKTCVWKSLDEREKE